MRAESVGFTEEGNRKQETGTGTGTNARLSLLSIPWTLFPEKIVAAMAIGGRRGRSGGFSVARLRRWLLAGVVALLLILAGLISYTRFKARKLLTDLPHRLGADIKSETNGFTWSQSVKGHTIFTAHAARAIQHANGKTTLRDVAITLYGPVGSNRRDSIRGDEFEYDEPNGIVRAMGEVHLDLASPAPGVTPLSGVEEAVASKLGTSVPSAAKPAAPPTSPSDGKRIQVTTSGLVFLQKLGVAATDQPIHIVYGDLRGGATGADYESDTGMLRLRSAVEMSGTQNRQMVHLQAAAAEVDRVSQIATMHVAHVQTDTAKASGDTVVIATGKSGGIESVHADGHATLEGKDGMKAQAPKMDAQMGATGKLHDVVMQGGVQFANGKGSTGSAQRGTVHFDNAGTATSAEFSGSVHLDQAATGAQRTLTAERVTTVLGQDAAGHSELRDATASGSGTGSAVLRVVEEVPATKSRLAGTHVTVLRGGTLHAVTARRGGVNYVSEVRGTGGTSLEQDDGAGTVRTSSGEELQVALSAPALQPKGTSSTAGQVQTAVQTGHVVVTQKSPPKRGQAAQDTRATGSRAEFENASGRLVLTGSPQVTSPAMQLAADRIALQQGSGDAEATGSVRGVYLASAAEDKRPAEPVHLLADHATVTGGGDSAKLFGVPGKPARVWSSTAQIEAPVIETDRATGKLFAHAVTEGASPSGSAPGTVHMLLPVTAASGKSASSTGGAVRITGGSLVYTPADARNSAHADISGGVRLDSPSMQLTAKSAVAVLAGSKPEVLSSGNRKAATSSLLPGGNLQSVTATGDVHMQQPGRTGTGEQLVYTATDQRYELTGTSALPPRITDSQRGTVTGNSLIFHGADDSVEVSGEAGHRVRTETEVARPSRSR
jgi:lipopolysaccharide export system protein LptA